MFILTNVAEVHLSTFIWPAIQIGKKFEENMIVGRREVALFSVFAFFHEDGFEENSFNGDVLQAAYDIGALFCIIFRLETGQNLTF